MKIATVSISKLTFIVLVLKENYFTLFYNKFVRNCHYPDYILGLFKFLWVRDAASL